jgi:hypothetical protein
LNETYKDSLSGLIEHSLINLYLNCAESPRLIPTKKRNQLLIRHLKPKIKDPKFSRLKNELRMFLSIGRHEKGNLEAKLTEIYTLPSERTDVQSLFDLLEIVRCETGLDSRVVNATERRLPSFVYVLREQIENNFSKEGDLVNPISLFADKSKVGQVVKAIEKTELFNAEVQHVVEDQGHILLCKILRN